MTWIVCKAEEGDVASMRRRRKGARRVRSVGHEQADNQGSSTMALLGREQASTINASTTARPRNLHNTGSTSPALWSKRPAICSPSADQSSKTLLTDFLWRVLPLGTRSATQLAVAVAFGARISPIASGWPREARRTSRDSSPRNAPHRRNPSEEPRRSRACCDRIRGPRERARSASYANRPAV